MVQLSTTAANKRVRELENLLSAYTRVMHDATQYAIEDMMLLAGTQEVKADEYVGALRFLKRANKHQKRMAAPLEERSKLDYWGYGIYSPFDHLESRTVYRARLKDI
jgi:hypothetical protein